MLYSKHEMEIYFSFLFIDEKNYKMDKLRTI